MTWIDERLFGWTRSSKRGTSAWSGVDDPSRANTPDETDEEDAGDYDDVVGLIATNDDQGFATHKVRSRQSSYADLQRVRLNPTDASSHNQSSNSHTKPSNTLNVDHQHDQPEESSRLLHRPRRQTLSDDVPVKRIAAIDPTKTFSDATESLNEGIMQAKYKSI
jgi:glycerol-3-phosphate O-acyltransferase/dihydroxyacetone phosphate acyltransferase